MVKSATISQQLPPQHIGAPFSLKDEAAYLVWRDAKLAEAPRSSGDLFVDLADMGKPARAEIDALSDISRCCNMALFRSNPVDPDEAVARRNLKGLVASCGLCRLEDQRSGESDGIVTLEVAAGGDRVGYIPYTNRQVGWHTDGYYNFHGPRRMIRSMVLYCVRRAPSGGANRFLDHEIAYIRLRDLDPAFIEALMHPQAMTIPVNREPDGRIRPENTGPVFILDPGGGALVMRYSRRKHNIVWRDDTVTRAAVAALEAVLDNDELVLKHTLQPGEGIVCNNVLHARTSFTNGDGSGRLLLRVRSYDRIAST